MLGSLCCGQLIIKTGAKSGLGMSKGSQISSILGLWLGGSHGYHFQFFQNVAELCLEQQN